MIITLLIYFSGFLLSYILIRLTEGYTSDWDDVIVKLFISTFSWFSVLAISLLYIISIIETKISKINIKLPNIGKPPKWL